MDKHLDFTIDFETCSLGANAAVMQAACVPWTRDGAASPFLDGEDPYVGYVDLRSCVVDGFDFDQATVKWWSEQSEAAKKAVTIGLPEPIEDVLIALLDYIRATVSERGLESICLWCQGPDVDIAILRNLCRKFDVNLRETIQHTSFRDCRTIILEGARAKLEKVIRNGKNLSKEELRVLRALHDSLLKNPRQAYALYDELPERYAGGGATHDALYDAVRSSWLTWQALRWISQ